MTKIELVKVSDRYVRLKKEIREHAFNSIYRMNASNSDVYTFYYYNLENGKETFGGCWDMRDNLSENNAHYLLDLKDNCFYSIFEN